MYIYFGNCMLKPIYSNIACKKHENNILPFFLAKFTPPSKMFKLECLQKDDMFIFVQFI